jgi:hypothetical protein
VSGMWRRGVNKCPDGIWVLALTGIILGFRGSNASI